MINLIRHQDFFNPIEIQEEIHIVGTGAVGSHIATFLARLGVESLHLWDFDTVGDHNIPNQMFREIDIGKLKTIALKEQLEEINSDIGVILHGKYNNEELTGYVFACVDNIEIRKELYESNEYNARLKAVFDTRIGLDEGQVFSAQWDNDIHRDNLIAATQFSHDEVKEETTACGSKLAILPTVVLVSNIAVTNFINLLKTNSMKHIITFNSFNLSISR